MNGNASLGIPKEDRFSLVGDADSTELGPSRVGGLGRPFADGKSGPPNFFRVMFDLAGFGVRLAKLFLRHPMELKIGPNGYGASAGRALVESEDARGHRSRG